jgi:hypothetical protein
MTYTPVSWNAGDLVTSAKLGQMVDNDIHIRECQGQLLWNYCSSSMSTGETDWHVMYTDKIYLPQGARTNLTLMAYWRQATGGTSYLKFRINEDTDSGEVSSNETNIFRWETMTCDVSSLSTGAWYTFEILGKNSGSGTCQFNKGSLIISPES